MSAQVVSASIEIDAPVAQVFAVVANPHLHHRFDGSGTVRTPRSASQSLQLGDEFSMRMRLGVPYVMTSTVVEYEENQVLAWRHYGRHIWRYEFEAISDSRTRVTESFDYETALWPRGLELLGYPDRHTTNIAESLQRLKQFVESEPTNKAEYP